MTSDTDDQTILKQVQAALEVEPRINLHRHPLRMKLQNGQLTLAGETASIAAKRVALRAARRIVGNNRIEDCLLVVPAEHKGDGEILDALGERLLRQGELKNCTLRRLDKGQLEVLHEAIGDDSCGDITFAVAEGVVSLDGRAISLSHRRLAEILAWWAPGCRNVVNRLAVVPAELDTDDELSDAVRLALEIDPLVHADQISVSTEAGVVALDGTVGRPLEREMAELDAWYVAGVNGVINRVELAT